MECSVLRAHRCALPKCLIDLFCIKMEAASNGSGAETEAVVSIAGIREASARIKPHVHLTPVMTNKYIDETSGREVFFKCELFQKTGSFKARGACNAVLLTPPECRDIVTHSSGNHAQVRAGASCVFCYLHCSIR